MARGVNKVILVGNLGKDPEQRSTQSGMAVVNVTIATSDSWRDKATGEQQERTEWHNVVFFNKLGEIAAQYLRKGSQVYVEGSLRTRKWQDKNGQDRYTTEIIAENMQMLGGKGGGGGGGGSMGGGGDDYDQAPPRSSAPARSAAPARGAPPSRAPAPEMPPAADHFEDDDIPF